MTCTPQIDYRFYPHIIEAVVAHTDHNTKLRFRATCRELRRYVDALLLSSAVHFKGPKNGMVAITAYTGTAYPFFLPDGDRAAQRRAFKKADVMRLIDVDASAVGDLLDSALLRSIKRVDIKHHKCFVNYQLGRSLRLNYLGMDLFWKCSCDEIQRLHPGLSHTAEIINIILHTDDNYLTRPYHENRRASADQMNLEDGCGRSKCHLLKNVLNGGVSLVRLVVMPLVPATSLRHLPAFIFPEASATDVRPELEMYIQLSIEDSTNMSPEHFEQKAQVAFAEHLRIPANNISVESRWI